MTDLRETVRASVELWMKQDSDHETRGELQQWLDFQSWAEIEDAFEGLIGFGTAGLRGIEGPGPNRMNCMTVALATVGVCRWIQERNCGHAHRICLGFDGRKGSHKFAREVAEVAAGLGVEVIMSTAVISTPHLAFSVRDQHVCAGVMITASHNPSNYNGFKVFGYNGAQIIPSEAKKISEVMESVKEQYPQLPRVGMADARDRGMVRFMEDEVCERYLENMFSSLGPVKKNKRLAVAYTALHGVGEPYAREVAARSEVRSFYSVASQAKPDAAFPTVEFPNPEEPGAMDAVLELAKEKQTDLAVAHDPDADRFAVAYREGGGAYVLLTGNEIGCLFAHHILKRRKASSIGEKESEQRKPLILSTIVSSPMMKRIAEKNDAYWEPTLTGFKWIAHRAMQLESKRQLEDEQKLESEQPLEFVFGYEEALGYCMGKNVFDKDGVSAMLFMMEIAEAYREQGKTLGDALEELYLEYGLWMSRQVSFRFDGLRGREKIENIMQRLREHPPQRFGQLGITETEDYQNDTRTLKTFPPANILEWKLEGGHRILLRPSGTEPKLKAYIDVHVSLASSETVTSKKDESDGLLTQLSEDIRTWVSRGGVQNG